MSRFISGLGVWIVKTGQLLESKTTSASCLITWTGYRAGGYRISRSDSKESTGDSEESSGFKDLVFFTWTLDT